MKRLFPLVIFANAILLFQVQPLIAKMIVPWFGGTAAVWTACLLFFQVLLLGGYLYAHWLVRLQPKNQGRIHSTLLALSLLSLPIIPRSGWKPSGFEDPTFRILLVLAATVGLPYFLLSSTSPLVQAWYARARPAREPYRLYSLSNLGSMLALLSYPVVIEPLIATRRQAIGWSIAYAAAGAAFALLAMHVKGEVVVKDESPAPPLPGWRTRWLWIALPACASVLLLAITNHVCENIAAIPLLWVPPLALYLLSFILCFEGHAWYQRRLFAILLAVALGGMVYALALQFQDAGLKFLIFYYLIGLFVCCMVCHGELARLRPHPAHLTGFYLLVSLGGALGAIFVAVLAPRLFSGPYELPIALVGCAVLFLAAVYRDPSGVIPKPGAKVAWALAAALVLAFAINLSVTAWRRREEARVTVRNFYGVLRVVETRIVIYASAKDGGVIPVGHGATQRILYHGTIRHGMQFQVPALRRMPTTYFGPNSGIGLALRVLGERGPLKVGLAGLGAGTLAAYGRPGDHYTFYEINPLIVRLASSEFTFLSDSPAPIEVYLGDARLSLERQSPQAFDLLVADAFSGDAIPVHLLTREAFALYFRHLKPNGVLAVHVSNRFVNLVPVVRAEALYFHKQVITIFGNSDKLKGIEPALWMLVTGDKALLENAEIKKAALTLAPESDLTLWTDDYSSVFKLLK
jgi:hypothetical protein